MKASAVWATLFLLPASTASGCDYSLPDLLNPVDGSEGDALDADAPDVIDATAQDHATAPPCPLDAAASQAGCWVWLGSNSSGWAISNQCPPDHPDACSDRWDCCSSTSGCTASTSCDPCVDNTKFGSAADVTTFDSGPEEGGDMGPPGTGHRYDGFTAWYRNVPVIPGRAHTLRADIANLSASIADACVHGTESGSNYTPMWDLEVYDGSNKIGGLPAATWASALCNACPPSPGDLGVKTTSFTPSGSSVDIAVWGRHRSSQSTSEAFGVQVGVRSIGVIAQ